VLRIPIGFIADPGPVFNTNADMDLGSGTKTNVDSCGSRFSSYMKVSKKLYFYMKNIIVPDPWHFGMDPDPQIHASD
jgi:hypothetical protein